MTVLEGLRLYTIHRHESFSHKLHQKLCAI
jgi:hypothetical protein